MQYFDNFFREFLSNLEAGGTVHPGPGEETPASQEPEGRSSRGDAPQTRLREQERTDPMNRTPLSLLALALMSAPATAGLIPEPIQISNASFEWNKGDGTMNLVLEPFNNMGGTRVLEAITVGYSAGVDASVILENLEDRVVGADEYVFDFGVITFLTWDNGLPLFAMGGLGRETPSVDLQPQDGIADGGPDSVIYPLQGHAFTRLDLVPQDYFRFTGDEPITVQAFPSAQFGPPPPPPLLEIRDLTHYQSGTLSVEYRYREIPAPMACAPLAALAFGRRRRS